MLLILEFVKLYKLNSIKIIICKVHCTPWLCMLPDDGSLRIETRYSMHNIVDRLFHLIWRTEVASDQLLNYKYTDEATLGGLQKSRNIAVELCGEKSFTFSRKMLYLLSN